MYSDFENQIVNFSLSMDTLGSVSYLGFGLLISVGNNIFNFFRMVVIHYMPRWDNALQSGIKVMIFSIIH